jgi:CRISPR-associated protein Cas6
MDRQTVSPMVDLHFRLLGGAIPWDHGYLLYSAISRLTEEGGGSWFHEAGDAGLLLVRGAYARGRLILDRTARFGLRLPAHLVPRALQLSGRRLDLGGTQHRIGTTRAVPLIPAAALKAQVVTTRNGHDEARFDREVRKQLHDLQIAAAVERGKRTFLSNKGRRIIGYELLVHGLTAEESIRIQEKGLGGRRKMGCGVFVGVRE